VLLIQVHTELLGVLFCGRRARFWDGPPISPSQRSSNLLKHWDYQGHLDEQVKSPSPPPPSPPPPRPLRYVFTSQPMEVFLRQLLSSFLACSLAFSI